MKGFNLLIGLMACAALSPATDSSAQNALGDGDRLGSGSQLNAYLNSRRNPDGSFNQSATGNALDANTMVGGGPWNRGAANSMADFDARNDVVTGNVAAGRGFRGSVGYTAEFDFRAQTGANDLFRFRADSAYSSPAFARLGSSFEQLRFGQDMAIIEIPRADTGASANRLRPPAFRAQEMLAARARIDRETMISSSVVSVESNTAPRLVGAAYDSEGRPLVLNASPLRGLTAEPPQHSPALAGLTLWDSARVREDVKAGRRTNSVGSPFETSFESGRDDTARLRPELAGTSIRPQSVSDYDAVLQRVAERFAKLENEDAQTEPGQQERIDERYNELRRQLTGEQPPETEKDEQEDPTPEKPGADQPSQQDPLLGELNPPSERDKNEPKKAPPTFTSDEFTEALRHGERIEDLSPENLSRLDELMSRAEQRLDEGQYFLAERLFDRVLRFTPGHPLATVGVAHSQIGSGLYLSAAATLRTLLSRQPELIDVTYGPNVLPAPQRLKDNVAAIQEKLKGVKNLDSYAFLLAYLGHQLGDRALVQQGLDALDQAEPDDELSALLRSIWLAPEDTSEPPPPKPDAPAAPLVEPGK